MKGKVKAVFRAGALVAGVVVSRVVLGQSIGEMAGSAAEDLGDVPALVSIVIYILGVAFMATGLVKLKRKEASREQSVSGALVTLGVGFGLVLLPSVLEGISGMFGVEGGAEIERPTIE